MKFNTMNIWVKKMVLRFNAAINYRFWKGFSYSLIYYLFFNVIKWLLWNAQLGIFLCLFNLKILSKIWNKHLLHLVLISVGVNKFIWLLCKLFVYADRVGKQFILSFQAMQTIFFNIFHTPAPPPPLQKNNGPSLS